MDWMVGEVLKAMQASWAGLVVTGLAAFLLGAVPGFLLGRFGKFLDRRQEAKDRKADWKLEPDRDAGSRVLTNTGSADAKEVRIKGAVGFDPCNLRPEEKVRFRLEDRRAATVTVEWVDERRGSQTVELRVPDSGKRPVRPPSK